MLGAAVVRVLSPVAETREVAIEFIPAPPVASEQTFVCPGVLGLANGTVGARGYSFVVSETTSHGEYAVRPTTLGIRYDAGVFYRYRTT